MSMNEGGKPSHPWCTQKPRAFAQHLFQSFNIAFYGKVRANEVLHDPARKAKRGLGKAFMAIRQTFLAKHNLILKEYIQNKRCYRTLSASNGMMSTLRSSGASHLAPIDCPLCSNKGEERPYDRTILSVSDLISA